MSWARKQQIKYFLIVFGFFLVIGLVFYYFYKPISTCFDRKQNQTELGVDCGGPCSLACSSQLTRLNIWWTQVMQTAPGKYDVTALVENPNQVFGVKTVPYNIRIYDDHGLLLTERQGLTSLNPKEKFVIFEPNINTEQKVAAKAFLSFGLTNSTPWVKLIKETPRLFIGERNYTNSPYPKLNVTVKNGSLITLVNIPFVAVLSDQGGNAYASSATMINSIAGGESKKIVFTWPIVNFGSTTPAAIDIYPKLDLFKIYNVQ